MMGEPSEAQTNHEWLGRHLSQHGIIRETEMEVVRQ